MRGHNHGERRRAVHAPELGRKRVSVALESASRQRVRIAGTLEELVPEERLFSLILGEGETLRCGISSNVPAETLKTLLGRPVLISGTAFFSRSGSLVRIEADHVQPAQGNVSFWSRLPRQVLGGIDRRAVPESRESSGLSAIVGQWPGDESDEEILALLEEIS
jgi:hypothetical protein